MLAAEECKNLIPTFDKEKGQRINNIKGDIASSVNFAYDGLVHAISCYRFIAHSKDSWGAHQSRANHNIIRELSLLREVLNAILQNITGYFATLKEAAPDEPATAILEKLDELIEGLKASAKNMSLSGAYYHETWDDTNRRRIRGSKNSLGQAKNEWRLARNEACHTILYFFQEMLKINKAIEATRMVSGEDSIYKAYIEGLSAIKKGPNYYCYLDEGERYMLTTANIARKRGRKENSIQN